LKTEVLKGTVGSNPTPSATFFVNDDYLLVWKK
jgi:hypothetical protein